MKIAIIGNKGQLGSELTKILADGKADIGAIDSRYNGASVVGVDIDTLDITDFVMLNDFMAIVRPDIVINCSAFTNVDKAEDDVATAYAVNATGCLNLAIKCREYGAKLLSVSTDYVFGGDQSEPYAETDTPCPHNVYGKSKLMGERNIAANLREHYIVRTSWLYGEKGKNFVYTMLRLGKEKDSVTVVNDQRGNPTNANDLAYHILKIALTDNYGIYHCTGNGICSWYDFACRIMEKAKLNCKVVPVTSEEYPSKVTRPKFSALDNKRLRETVGDEMRDWRDAIDCFIGKLSERE